MSKARRTKTNSAEAVIAAIVAVNEPELKPPPHVTLSTLAAKFWPAIIQARARAEWDGVDLVIAAQLAECQASIENESVTLRTEGMVVPNERGTLVENARNRVVQTLAQREMALMRSLRMGGKPAGEVHHLTNSRNLERATRGVNKEVAAEVNLLA